MKVIASIFRGLSAQLPGNIGRYDDGYNANCTGDTFQGLGVPTILFEAGHTKDDYTRDKTREYVLYAIYYGLNAIATNDYKKISSDVYFEIPENEKLFYDIILRNAAVNDKFVDVAIQFNELLQNKEIKFLGTVENIGPKLAFFAHREINCNFQKVTLPDNKTLSENDIVEKILVNNEILMIN